MSVADFLEHLGFTVTQANSQLRVDCPQCGDAKGHLYVAPGNGLGYCHKCAWSVNPYKIAEEVTGRPPAEIMAMLERFGLNDSDAAGSGKTDTADPATPLRVTRPLALDKDDLRELTDDEKQRFCELKRIEVEAFDRFKPYRHRNEPWVLLPAFEPGDQSRACGWLRCGIDGQPIQLADGRTEKYPAVAGSRHGLFGLPWLMKENPDTVVFCEGWRDALAAISVGVHATASSGGASTWRDDWLAVFAGRAVYICMDRDEAGERAAARAAKAISTVAKAVYMVELPYEVTESHGRDLHDYIVADGHGHKFLLLLRDAKRYQPLPATGCGSGGAGQIVLANSQPLTVARALYADVQAAGEVLRYYNQQGAWCAYTGAGYAICQYVDMQNRVWRFAPRCVVPEGKEHVPKPLNCSENTIRNTLSAMASFEGVEVPSAVTAPAWLDGRRRADGPDPDYVIALENGLLDVSGEPVLMGHTPAFLNFNILPYAYDPQAGCGEWLRFLGQVFARQRLSSTESGFDTENEEFVEVEELVPDEEKIQTLQEWFGLLLTSEMKYHKMLGIIGPKRSGKGTIGRVLTALIGSANVATPTFASMVESFGLQGLLNARVAIFGDANMDKDPVVVGRAVEKLKTISGEDGVDVNRKYERVIQGARLKVRFVMVSNNLQRLTDPTGTVSDRFIFLKTTQSFYGREDLGLEGRLMVERPGILNWAIAGLRRLKARGHLLEPAESVEMRTRSKELGSNVIAFVNEGCRRDEGLWTRPDEMYDAFKRWCEQDGSQPMKKRAFRQEFEEAFPKCACSKHRLADGGGAVWVYWGIEPLTALSYS